MNTKSKAESTPARSAVTYQSNATRDSDVQVWTRRLAFGRTGCALVIHQMFAAPGGKM
jgi:hypothetical protein